MISDTIRYNLYMSENEARRTQAQRTKTSRAKILQEATRQFAQNGFRGSTLREIAEAIEMSEAGLLYHFPSKDQLLISVLQERDQANKERFGKKVTNQEQGFLDSLKELVRHNEKVPGLVQLFTVLVSESLTDEHPSQEYFVWRYQAYRQMFLETISKCQEMGNIRQDIDAETLTIMIFAMMDGLQIQWLLEPEKISMSKVFEEFVKLLEVN